MKISVLFFDRCVSVSFDTGPITSLIMENAVFHLHGIDYIHKVVNQAISDIFSKTNDFNSRFYPQNSH